MQLLEQHGRARRARFELAMPLLPAWLPLACLALWAFAAIWLGYRAPLEVRYDVGSGDAPIFGAYGNEHSEQLSYIYTDDRATLLIPQAGASAQIVRLRLAGPGTAASVTARAAAAGRTFPLGEIHALRDYHLLVPTDTHGSVRLDLLADTVKLPGDNRPLGLLLDQVRATSAGGTPPAFVVASALLMLAATASMVGQLRLDRSVRAALACGIGMLAVIGLLVARGRVELPPLWWQVLVALFLAAVVTILRSGWLARVRPLLAVASMFLIWRAGLWLVAAFGIWFSGAVERLGVALTRDGNYYMRDAMFWNTFVQGWTQWDSEHYTVIANTGYTFAGVRWPNVAFFPLYPLLLKPVAALAGGSYNAAGVIVANVALLGALLLLYDLVARDFGRRIGLFTVLFALAIPTSFFFGAVYSESLALLLAVAAVWAIRRERWWLASGAGLLLAQTRMPGVAITPVLALAYMQHVGWNWRAIRWPILAAALPPLGLASFMAYQWAQFGTPFAFMQAQQAWENQLSPPWAMPINLVTMIGTGWAWPNLVFQALFYAAFIVLMVVALRKLPLVYGLSMLLFLIPPFLSSWTWSVSRHVLIGFAGYLVLAQWAERRWVRWALLGVMLPLLVLATLLFVNGWWVA